MRGAHSRRGRCIPAALHSNHPAARQRDLQARKKWLTQPRAPLSARVSSGDGIQRRLPSPSLHHSKSRPRLPRERAGRQAGLLPGLPHRPQQPKPRSAGSRSEETPTVLAPAEATPVFPEPQAGECSLAAFGKGTCQNTVSDSYSHTRFETVNFSPTTLQAPVFSSSFPATAAGLFP